MKTCGHTIPTDATFCPFCGEPNTPARVNVAGLEAMIAAAEVDLDESVIPRRSVIPWVLAAAATFALGVGVLWGAANIEHPAQPVVEHAEVIATIVEKSPAISAAFNPGKLTTTATKNHGEVFYNGQSLIRFEGVRGSRYSQIDERTEAVKLRISHAFAAEATNGKTPRFAARMVDGTYQIVWQRPGSTFLITEITKDDVRARESNQNKTSAAILSNLLADRLNIMLELENNIPNS